MKEMDSKEQIGGLEEESLKRRERLKALKDKAISGASKPDSVSKKSIELPQPKFRSYKPSDESLKKLALSEARPANIEKEVQSQMLAANERSVIDVLDVSNLAPRKPDWDLKRDAAKKLERLERRTQRAIAELIRERLKNEESLDLATSVALGVELQATADD